MTDERCEGCPTAFDRDHFILGAPLLSASEKHVVWDQEGRPLLFVDSPSRVGRLGLAVALAVGANFVTTCVLIMLTFASQRLLQIDRKTLGQAPLAWFVIALFLAGITAVVVFLAVLGSQRFVLRAGGSKGQPLAEIRPAGRSFFATRYTVCDADGAAVARLCVNHLYGLWRLRWRGYRADQSPWFYAAEESRIPRIVRGMARVATPALLILLMLLTGLLVYVAAVVLLHGQLHAAEIVLAAAAMVFLVAAFVIRQLRGPNWLIVRADDGTMLGKLFRQGSDRRDHLVLLPDREQYLDRRVAVAVAVLMDRS
jgi:hypothetical protein